MPKKNNFKLSDETIKWIAIIIVIILAAKYLPSLSKGPDFFQFGDFSFQAPTTPSTESCVNKDIGAEYVKYFTNYPMSGTTGWTAQYTTNSNPNQNYSSSDYSSTPPVNKYEIRFLRWKKPVISGGESGTFLYKVIIQ